MPWQTQTQAVDVIAVELLFREPNLEKSLVGVQRLVWQETPEGNFLRELGFRDSARYRVMTYSDFKDELLHVHGVNVAHWGFGPEEQRYFNTHTRAGNGGFLPWYAGEQIYGRLTGNRNNAVCLLQDVPPPIPCNPKESAPFPGVVQFY